MRIHTLCIATGLAFAAVACDRQAEGPPPQAEQAVPPAAVPGDPTAPPAGPVAGAEREFITQAASSGVAEVEASQLVASRTGDERLKSFAEQLEREHRAANDELQRLAGARGIDLPATAEGEPRERLNRLAGLSGEELGKTYLQEFGIDAHQQSIQLYERQAREGQDAELREFAERTLPTLREHLAMAQQIQGGGTSGPAGEGGGATPGGTTGGSQAGPGGGSS